MKKGIVAIALLGLGAFAHGADIKAGEAKAAVCAGCHGAGGVSTLADFPILAGQGEKYLAKQLHDFKSGARINLIMQPQVAALSDEDIEDLAAYFASQKRPPAATTGAGENPDDMLALGESIFRGGDAEKGIPACLACHGPSGAGIEPAAFPQLGGQHAKYTRSQLIAFQNAANLEDLASDADKASLVIRDNDPNGMMRDTTKKMTPKQIEAVAHYIQGLYE